MVFEENDNTEQVELLVAMVMEMWACLVKYASKQCIILVDWMMEAIATVSAPTQWINMSVRKQLVENSLQQAVNHSEKKHGMTSQQIDRQTDLQDSVGRPWL